MSGVPATRAKGRSHDQAINAWLKIYEPTMISAQRWNQERFPAIDVVSLMYNRFRCSDNMALDFNI